MARPQRSPTGECDDDDESEVERGVEDPAKAKLDNLATEIQTGHRQCVEAIRGVVTQAAAIGKLLNEAKGLVGHRVTPKAPAADVSSSCGP